MIFNEEKFHSLSSIQRLKKLAFCLRDALLKRQNSSHYKEMITWLNLNEAYRFKIPQTQEELSHLYQSIIHKITEDDPYQEKVMFDDMGQVRTIFPIILILDNIRSPFNVGSFFRTAESLGVSKIWLIGITPQPKGNTKISRTAKGAIIEHHYFANAQSVILELKTYQEKTIIGAEKTPQSKDLNQLQIDSIDHNNPLFIIFGNEEFGVSKELLEQCNYIYHIPLLGQKNSINVSVAAGIFLYHIVNKLNPTNA